MIREWLETTEKVADTCNDSEAGTTLTLLHIFRGLTEYSYLTRHDM